MDKTLEFDEIKNVANKIAENHDRKRDLLTQMIDPYREVFTTAGLEYNLPTLLSVPNEDGGSPSLLHISIEKCTVTTQPKMRLEWGIAVRSNMDDMWEEAFIPMRFIDVIRNNFSGIITGYKKFLNGKYKEMMEME